MHLYTIFSALHLSFKGHSCFFLQLYGRVFFYRCINQLLIMRFDYAGYILGATVAHLHCKGMYIYIYICIIYICIYCIYNCIYIHIYIYLYAIMKTMCPPSYHHSGFLTTHTHELDR